MAGSFIQELNRRNVSRVAAIYVIVSWLLMQIGDVMFPALRLPEWTTTMLVAFLLLGFPIALVLSWAYEATPDGIKRTSDVEPDESITTATGRKINYSIIAVLVIAVVFLLAKDLSRDDPVPPAAATGSDQSIAVLPFANRSAAEENAEFFAAGVHDELLTLLSKLGGLKVISRTSVENLDEGLSIPEIGALLGVATVLEGQVQRAGDSLRINVQLINAAEEDHLWATTYDRELTAGNVFQVQSEIARTIADSLHAELSESDEALLSRVPTENTEALRLYMLGRQLTGRSSFGSMRQAARYFEEAVKLDPGYAEAWASLANAHNLMLQTGLIETKDYIEAATPTVARALQLDENLAEAHAQQGTLHWRSGNLHTAEASFQTALDLNPNDSKSLRIYGNYLRMTGRPAEAIPILERALVGDPLSVLTLFELGKAEMYTGHSERTLQYARRILEIDPSSVYGYTGSLQAHFSVGQLASAFPWYLKVFEADPEDSETPAHLSLLTENVGAPAWTDRYMDLARSLGPDKPATLKCEVLILAQRGHYDEVLTIARNALEAGLDDRWSSNEIFLRVVRDDALRTGNYADAIAPHEKLYPELFTDAPLVHVGNVNTAANLSLLLRRSGDVAAADQLIDAALAWYQDTQVPGVYGMVNIVNVELLALKGEKENALSALRDAVDDGWRWSVHWYLEGENLSILRNEPEFQVMAEEIRAELAMQLEEIRALPDMGKYDLRNKRFD